MSRPEYLVSLIFSSGCHTPTDMTLRLVLLKDLLDPKIEPPIHSFKPFSQVFMYGRYGLECFYPVSDSQKAK